MKKVYTVMSVKNRREETMLCLEALSKQTYKSIQVIVVDDGSTDGLNDAIKKTYPKTIILRGDGDLWFTGAMRIGLKYVMDRAKAEDYLLFLNNDTVFGKDFVKILVNTSKKYGDIPVGSFASSNISNEIRYHTHKRRKGLTGPTIIGFEDEKYDDVTFNTDSLNTKGTIVPMKIVFEVGNLSKLFPHYGSDYDYFYRVKRRGYKLGVSRKAMLYTQDDDIGYADRMKKKLRLSVKEWLSLFYSKKSYMNFYSRTVLVLRYTPFPWKMLSIMMIYAHAFRLLVTKVIFGKRK